MRARRITGADPIPLGAPADWKEDENGQCTALFVRREKIDGIDFMRSAWDADPGEAMKMFAGAPMIAGISGQNHAVVHYVVGELPETFEPVVMARRFTTPDGHAAVRVEMLFPDEGGRRLFANVLIDGTLADAISIGVTRVENFARNKGWIA